jgi:hypothetical protein
LWLLASEADGELPDIRKIAFRLRTDEKTIKKILLRLDHWVCTKSYESVQTDTQARTESYEDSQRQKHDSTNPWPRVRDRIREEEDIDIEREEETYYPPNPQGGEAVEFGDVDMFGNQSPAPATPSKAALSADDVQAVVTTWNQYPSLPAARGISEKRDKAIRAVLKDKATRELWQESIAKIAASPHHIGQNERGWRADFDWWCRPDRVLRFAEMGLAPAKTTEQVNADMPEIVVYLSVESLIAHTGKDPKHEDVWRVYCHKYGLPDCLSEQYAVNGPDKESPFGKIELAEMHNTPIKVTYID